MGVLKVNVGDAVTPDWRKIGCGTSGPVSQPNGWSISPTPDVNGTLFTVTSPSGTAAGTQVEMLAMDGPVTMTIGGTPDYSAARVGLGYKSFTGVQSDTFDFSGNTGFEHWVLTGAVGAGPRTVLAIFVTSALAVTGRLKLWTGSGWVREKCDDEPPVVTEEAPWHWVSQPSQVGSTVSYTWQATTNPSTGSAYFGMYTQIEWTFPDGTKGYYPSAGAFIGVAYPGSVTALHSYSYSSVPATAVVTQVICQFTSNGSDTHSVVTWGPPVARPLKMWDGTAWTTVACLVSA